MKVEIKPSNFGLLVMLGAVGLLFVGSLGAELFTSRFSLLVIARGNDSFLGRMEISPCRILPFVLF